MRSALGGTDVAEAPTVPESQTAGVAAIAEELERKPFTVEHPLCLSFQLRVEPPCHAAPTSIARPLVGRCNAEPGNPDHSNLRSIFQSQVRPFPDPRNRQSKRCHQRRPRCGHGDQAYRMNATHGRQLVPDEKRAAACDMFRKFSGTLDERYAKIADILSIKVSVAKKYAAEARSDEQQTKRDRAWDLWLDCWTQTAIGDDIDESQRTVSNWIENLESDSRFSRPPGSARGTEPGDSGYWGCIQHFDVWSFQNSTGDSTYFRGVRRLSQLTHWVSQLAAPAREPWPRCQSHRH